MWSQDGQDFRNSKYYYAKVWATGYFGYYAGLNKIIIDRYALSDPFLARLPAIPGHRVGHFERNLPDGYYESVMRGINIVENLALREFYGKIRIITQGRIFTAERFKTIFLMNIGKYDYLTKA
jgi:arabinofuranosyltransferase